MRFNHPIYRSLGIGLFFSSKYNLVMGVEGREPLMCCVFKSKSPSALYLKVKPGGSKRLSNTFTALILHLTWWRDHCYYFILVSIMLDLEPI